MQQGKKPASLLSGTSQFAIIPLLYNGSSRIGLIAFGLDTFVLDHRLSPAQLGGPFGFCAFARLTPILPGSLKIALKRTRPRQRIWLLLGVIL
jgi:hypothetical protein